MPTFFTVTKNPIARAGIIRKLMAKGYSLYQHYTVGDYFSKWPAKDWPVIVVRSDGPFAGRPTIDLAQTPESLPSSFQRVSSNAGIASIPNAIDINKQAEPPAPPKALVFPEPSKYSIEYMKADGSMGNYVISNPIEASNDAVTAYAFGRGVRTFKKARVRSFSKVS